MSGMENVIKVFLGLTEVFAYDIREVNFKRGPIPNSAAMISAAMVLMIPKRLLKRKLSALFLAIKSESQIP
ncbi:MAG: hypothetical protein ACFFCW_49775 [Candidatus Hodarchaeota archaeon]